MKKLLGLLCFTLFFASCSSDEVEFNTAEGTIDKVDIQHSKALRFTFEKMKENKNLAGRGASAVTEDLCFQFDYPVLLEYNNGSQVTVLDYEQLLQLLLDETVNLHIVGIGFPFNITNYTTNAQETIAAEADFETLISNCDYDVIEVNDLVSLTSGCFTVNYPVSLLVNGTSETFANQQEAQDYFVNYTGDIQSIDFVYPFSINLVSDNSTLSINNDFEVVNLINTICAIN